MIGHASFVSGHAGRGDGEEVRRSRCGRAQVCACVALYELRGIAGGGRKEGRVSVLPSPRRPAGAGGVATPARWREVLKKWSALAPARSGAECGNQSAEIERQCTAAVGSLGETVSNRCQRLPPAPALSASPQQALQWGTGWATLSWKLASSILMVFQ